MKQILIKVFLIFSLAVIVTGALLFLPAGSFDYWQGWVFMAVLFTPVLFVVSYLVRHDPALMERRLKFKEKLKSERKILTIGNFFFFIGFLIPGLDFRFGWSQVPVWLVIVSDVVIFIGYMLVFWVFRVNSYTSRIVEVMKGQKVISTGPYAYVRHPMYSGALLMFLFISTALGSYYAMIVMIPIIAILIYRIFDEEKLLLKDLKGYKEYYEKVKYRLIPGVW